MNTVYLVEPDAGVRDALKTFLESFDVPVKGFRSAEEFLRTAEVPRGCVLVEAELPGFNGLGLLKHLRSRGNDMPFVLLVDRATAEFAQRAKEAGVAGVLEKPLANDDLVIQLQRLLGTDCCGLAAACSESRTLADGTALVIRPIQPGDRLIEQAFVRELSPQSRYRRFFTPLRELSEAMLDRFTHIHYPNNIAFIATLDRNAVEEEIGVVRYVMTADGVAEFAVAVADEWHGRGVGTLLLQRLLACAARAGIRRLEGTALRDNRGMLTLARRLGFNVSMDAEDASQVQLTKRLTDC